MTSSHRPSTTSKIVSAFLDNEAPIRRFVRRLMSNLHDIEDICQETITRALEAEQKQEILEPRAFLYGVARNIVRKRLDMQSRSVIDLIVDFSPDDHMDNGPSVDEVIDSRTHMLVFMKAVATLPTQCQRVFVMKKVYGYSHKEIAKRMSISISTVEKHTATGLKRCLEYMERHHSSIASSTAHKISIPTAATSANLENR